MRLAVAVAGAKRASAADGEGDEGGSGGRRRSQCSTVHRGLWISLSPRRLLVDVVGSHWVFGNMQFGVCATSDAPTATVTDGAMPMHGHGMWRESVGPVGSASRLPSASPGPVGPLSLTA